MSKKRFFIPAQNIKQLLDNHSGCMATDLITVDGRPVGYMYRESPDYDADSGWRFLAGDESDEYMDDASNHGLYTVNTIANYDNDIIALVDEPIGSAFARNTKTGRFESVNSPIAPDDCFHPEFPVVTGDHQLNSTWCVSLPLKFNRRIEDGSLVLWRPGITLYFNDWGNDRSQPIDIRLEQLKADISPDGFELQDQYTESIQRFSYRLVEGSVHALYGFVIDKDGHLQVAIFFDNKSDIDLVRSMFVSITQNPN
jgi:hypothetical protein